MCVCVGGRTSFNTALIKSASCFLAAGRGMPEDEAADEAAEGEGKGEGVWEGVKVVEEGERAGGPSEGLAAAPDLGDVTNSFFCFLHSCTHTHTHVTYAHTM